MTATTLLSLCAMRRTWGAWRAKKAHEQAVHEARSEPAYKLAGLTVALEKKVADGRKLLESFSTTEKRKELADANKFPQGYLALFEEDVEQMRAGLGGLDLLVRHVESARERLMNMSPEEPEYTDVLQRHTKAIKDLEKAIEKLLGTDTKSGTSPGGTKHGVLLWLGKKEMELLALDPLYALLVDGQEPPNDITLKFMGLDKWAEERWPNPSFLNPYLMAAKLRQWSTGQIIFSLVMAAITVAILVTFAPTYPIVAACLLAFFGLSAFAIWSAMFRYAKEEAAIAAALANISEDERGDASLELAAAEEYMLVRGRRAWAEGIIRSHKQHLATLALMYPSVQVTVTLDRGEH